MSVFTRKLIKFVINSMLTGIISVAALALFWVVDPVGFRLTIFQPVRDVSFLVRELNLISDWDVATLEVEPTKTITIAASNRDEINIVADVYQNSSATKKPALILFHGSQPWGRKQGLIRLLSQHYSEEGWLSFAPDARGFGDTDDPADVKNPDSWKVARDVERIIDYVVSLDNVDKSNVFLLGHSLGANYVLEGGIRDERLRGAILIGPSRHIDKINLEITAWSKTRFAGDRKLDKPISLEVMYAARPRHDLELLSQGFLSQPGHLPLLFIDGIMEGKRNLNYLKTITNKIAPPVSYYTLKEAGHYAGVVNLFGSSSVYYKRKYFNDLLVQLDRFFSNNSQ